MSQNQAEGKLNGMIVSDIAIRQPVFITMLMLLGIVVGLLAYSALPVNFLPDFSVSTVSISVSYRGATPQTMADQVAKPIEDTLITINGVDHITTSASEGSVQLTVQFTDAVAPDTAIQEVREKVNAVVPRLPSGADTPVYRQFDPNDSPVLQMAITSDGSQTPLQLRTLIEDQFAPEVQRIAGVGSVDVSGGQERQINVLLNLDRLQALGIAPSQISNAIRNANTTQGLGTITAGDSSISLRAPSQIQQPADIAEISIPGTAYRVGDVATVEDGVAEVSSYARLDGQDAVTLAVSKRSGANTVSVAESARTTIETLLAANPNLRAIVTNDQSVEVRSSVESSIEEIVLSVIAAMLVVLLFFRDLRNTLITVAGLPVILILTFLAMQLMDITINVISLLALSLSVGLVIDDAIVVRENIFRYMERGYSPAQAASKGTAQVTLSVLAMTLTIIAVFLPVALVSGTTGVIFRSFGLTVAAAMAISLVEAFTFAPMLSAHLFQKHSAAGKQQESGANAPGAAATSTPAETGEELLEVGEGGALGRGYGRLLRWTLRHRWVAVVATVVMLVISVVFAAGMRVAFLPPQASDTFGLSFQMPPGTALAATDRLARQAEGIIKADSEVTAVQTAVGNSGQETGTFTIQVRDDEQIDTVRERLREQLAFLPNLALSSQSFQGGTNTGVTGRTIQVQLQTNRTIDELLPLVTQVEQLAQNTAGLTDIGNSYNQGRPELQFKLRGALAGDLGVTNNDIASSVRALVSGDTATTWQSNGNDIDVVVRLPPGDRADVNTINSITVRSGGQSVPLSSVADVTQGTGPTSIRRYDRQYEIIVGANVAPGYDQNQLERQLQSQINQLNFPTGTYVSYGGQTQQQGEGFSGLFVAMGLSVLFVYMVLASQFGSFSQPLVIMLAMPFSFLGAFMALRISGQALDITGLIGLIMLLGLVVKNSILLVDFTNQLRQSGFDKHAALEHAGAVRLRPILMTSTAIIAGAIPTALGIHFFSSGEGGEFRRSLAIVVIGGMLTSTLLTLLVVPTAYSLLDSLQGWVGRRLRRSPRPARPQPTASPKQADAESA